MKWFSRAWWQYIWYPPIAYYPRKGQPLRSWSGTTGKWRVRWCRTRGHDGIIFYNANGLEPDNRCQRCLETIA